MNIIKLHNKCRYWMNRFYSRLIRGSFGAIGKNCTIMLPFKSRSMVDVFLGDNITICGGGWIDCFREYGETQKWNPRLEIGDRTYIGHSSHIMVVGEMKIGRDVLIADKVYISDNLHGFEDIDKNIISQPLKHASVIIEDEVWLGENVCVLPGVTIGKHSVIGCNAVVTKSIPPYSVAVGSPAKVIRRLHNKGE